MGIVDITEQSSTGLQYMVDNKYLLDLKINVQPTLLYLRMASMTGKCGSVCSARH